MTQANGESYFGDWELNREHGTGTYTYPNGVREKREYKDGACLGKIRIP